jgi:hypothetical protein
VAVEVITWVFSHSQSKNGERLVMLAIADACNSPDGTGTWMSNAALCSKTNLSQRAVQVAVKGCELLGELKVDRNAGRGGVNRFAVVMTEKVQILRGADSAGFTDDYPAESAGGPNGGGTAGQGEKGAESAPPSHGSGPADSAPGTVSTKNSSSKSSKTRAKKPKTPDDERADVIEISNYLADMIERVGSKRPDFRSNKTWLRDARLLLDEKRPIPVDVDRVKLGIDWIEADDFWVQPIQSMSNLRKNWDKIRLAAQAKAKRSANIQTGRMTGGMAPASNAPKNYTPDARCEKHPTQPKKCGSCRADALAPRRSA